MVAGAGEMNWPQCVCWCCSRCEFFFVLFSSRLCARELCARDRVESRGERDRAQRARSICSARKVYAPACRLRFATNYVEHPEAVSATGAPVVCVRAISSSPHEWEVDHGKQASERLLRSNGNRITKCVWRSFAGNGGFSLLCVFDRALI